MATITIKVTSYTTVKVTYTLANESGHADDRYRLKVSNVSFSNSRSSGITEKMYLDVFILNQPSYTYGWGGDFVSASLSKGTKSKSWTPSEYVVFSKQHGAKSVTVTFKVDFYSSTGSSDFSKNGSASITLPSKTSYVVTLNPEGGSGGSSSLTKWYQESLSLTSGFTAPTRQGYLFYGWSATQEDAEAGITISSYTADSATTLYASWKPAIENARITSVDVIRVDNSSSTAESDDGEYCYGRIGFSLEGEAAGTVDIVITADPPILDSNNDPITLPSFAFTKQAGLPLSDVVSFHVPGCNLSTKYLFSATAAFTNSDYADQAIGDSTLGDYLSIAFFTWDALADKFPGQRPGHGFAFGQQSVIEGLCVAMDLLIRPWAGVIQMFAGSTPPAGWLLCDGSAVSRTTYATLFAAIGTTWGAGNGSTTFNLPDLRGRAPIGAGTGSGLTARTLGGTVGTETHTLTGPQSGIQAHSVAVAANWYISTYKGKRSTETVGGIGGTGWEISQVASSGGSWGGQNSISVAAKNATQAHNNMQPSAVVNFIIHTGKTN